IVVRSSSMLPEMLEDPYVEVALQALPSPDYIPGPEELEQAPPSPDYIPGPKHAPSAEETEPFKNDKSAAKPPPHPAYRMIARISIPAPVPMPAWTDSEVVRLLAISSPPASPLSPCSSPPPHIPFPPLPPILSPPSPVLSSAPPPSPIRSLGYRATMIRLRDKAASIHHHRCSYPLLVAGRTDMRLPYHLRRGWGAPVSTDTELGGYIREFETRVRQDTDEIYMRLDDEQTERQLLAGRLNMLFRDRCAHTYTRHLMETEARMSREAWVRAIDASDLVRGEETKPFKNDKSAAKPPPHPAYRMTARISIPAPVPMPAWTDLEVVRLLAISSPPASPLSPCSSPPPHIPFPPLPPILSPPSPVLSSAPPPSPIRSLGYRATMIRLRDKAASTSSPPLQLPSASRREDRPEVTLPPQKRL
nr:hypothetical protein [Tanacetum cinerariifolium]